MSKVQPPRDRGQRSTQPPGLTKLAPGTLPTIEEEVDRVAVALVRAATTIACPHLRPGDRGHACAIHTAGIMCRPCLAVHADRHTHELEHECSRCLQQGETMWTILGEAG